MAISGFEDAPIAPREVVMMQRFRTCVAASGILVLTLLGVWTAAALAADNPTSQNDDRLAGWLKKHPSADTNKDGVLTAEEARAYGREVRKERDRSEAGIGLEPTFRDVRYGPYLRNGLHELNSLNQISTTSDNRWVEDLGKCEEIILRR